MITDAFDRRTIAKMEVALERACLALPTGSEEHKARRIIASKIIECAKRGNASLIELTEAGYSAALQLSASARPTKKKATANYDNRPAGLEHMASMRGHGVAPSSRGFRVKGRRSQMEHE
jgi:hypothetical protein